MSNRQKYVEPMSVKVRRIINDLIEHEILARQTGRKMITLEEVLEKHLREAMSR